MHCVRCNEVNEDSKILCKKCFRKLDPPDTLFLDYLASKIIGGYQDDVFSIIKNYIKSHLYGFLLSCSLVLTSVSIVVNVISNDNSYIETVREKPSATSNYAYAGEGLNGEEVVRKYVKSLEDGDTSVAKKLSLDTFYPEIKEEIRNTTYSDEDIFVMPILDNELFEYGEYLFKDIVAEYRIYHSEIGYAGTPSMSMGEYGDYSFESYDVSLPYCSYNQCLFFDGRQDIEAYAIMRVEVLKVDGKYYVLGSQNARHITYNWLVGDWVIKNKGDVSTLNFQEIERDISGTCERNPDCVRALEVY